MRAPSSTPADSSSVVVTREEATGEQHLSGSLGGSDYAAFQVNATVEVSPW